MSNFAGEPEPTVPLDGRSTPPAPQAYPRPYQDPTGYQPYEPSGYPPQPYPQNYPVAQPVQYGRVEPVPYYGYPVDPRQRAYSDAMYAAQKSRVAAGLLGIFLGGLGIHNFYLGRTGIGLGQLLITVLTLGLLSPAVAVWSLVEAILILTRSPSFLTDAKGIPLRD